jgi:hypothetical protein
MKAKSTASGPTPDAWPNATGRAFLHLGLLEWVVGSHLVLILLRPAWA